MRTETTLMEVNTNRATTVEAHEETHKLTMEVIGTELQCRTILKVMETIGRHSQESTGTEEGT